MNYYELLEVSQNASKEVIRAAYKSLMQRYHPDKNPADSALASRAVLIVQAYEVLSDAGRRTAYDALLRRSLDSTPSPRSRPAHEVALPPSAAYRRRPAAPTSTSNWYLWLLVSVILGSSGLMFSLLGKKPSPAPSIPNEAARRQPETPSPTEKPENTSPTVAVVTKDTEAPIPSTRKIALLTSDLKVEILAGDGLPEDPTGRRHILSIPALTVEIGSIDAEKFATSLEAQKAVLVQKLSEKLTQAKYAELNLDGDRYLSKLIYDALRDITGTRGLEENAAEPNRYGVVAVSLPEGFFLR